jgi:O-acetyl-ADP-ribose deacetylase (regulator of RNase III)
MVSINEDGSVTVGSTRLRVVRSNIIEAPFEAIVISSDKSLSCRSVIEKQIAEVDPEFKDSCSAVPSVDGTRCGVGDSKAVSVNYSANSALKKAILVNVPSCRGRNVDPDYVKENLKKGSRSAVTLAHQLSVESVAISTLGCGNNGISFNGWAKIVPNALVEYFVENPNTAVRDTAICVLKPGQKTPIEKALQAGARRHIISQPSGQGRGSSSSSRRRS